MSWTEGGGGGGGGGNGFFKAGAGADGFFACVPLPLRGFEPSAAGFFAAGFDAVGSADHADGTQTTANAAANTRARARQASMGGDSTGRAAVLTNFTSTGFPRQTQADGSACKLCD